MAHWMSYARSAWTSFSKIESGCGGSGRGGGQIQRGHEWFDDQSDKRGFETIRSGSSAVRWRDKLVEKSLGNTNIRRSLISMGGCDGRDRAGVYTTRVATMSLVRRYV